MVNKIAVCPICGKRTFLRIQDGGYLKEYPIRINCINCRALIKGIYIMNPNSQYRGLHLLNADIEECDLDSKTLSVKNADYVAEISGELPCKNVRTYAGGIPQSPFIQAVDEIETMEDRIERLSYFAKNMEDWKRTKSTAFQLLDEGSIEYISIALKNKLGNYTYECDNYLKSLHCLQEVILEETRYLFLNPDQETSIAKLINDMAGLDREMLHELAEQMGGIQSLILLYRKACEVFSDFMSIYPNILPAETYLRFKNKEVANVGIATCSFSDIKTYYQDSYEALLSMLYIPVCLDNINERGNYQYFSSTYDDVRPTNVKHDFKWYRKLDNGTRINKLCTAEKFQNIIEIPANRWLRNGIGHNNIKYDPVRQIITAYDLKNPNKIRYQGSLMDVAVGCLGLAKSSVMLSEMILFMLRQEFRNENIQSILHPRFYKNAQVNDPCPCGSGKKYKKCCKREVDKISTK